MGTTPRSGLEGSSARPKRAFVPLKGRRAKEPHLIRPIRERTQRSLPRLDLPRRLQMRRQELREHRVHLLHRELLVFSVALDRDPVEPIGPAARVVLDRVVAVLDPEDPGRIGHRVSTLLVPKKACAHDLVRMQRVRRWDRDLRGPRVKLELKVIGRRDSSGDRVLIVDRDLIVGLVPIVDRDRRDLKVQQRETVRRDPKVPRVIDRRDPKEVVASTAGLVPIEGRDLIIADRDPISGDRDPKGVQGRRKRGHRKLELQFRRPNPRLRNKLQSRQRRRRQNPLRRRRSQLRTS